MQNCENLKVGDNVFVCGRSGRSLHQVEKITPKGFIRVDGQLYTKNGSQRGSGNGWYFTSIRPASDEEVEQFKKEKFVAAVVGKLHSVTNLQYEQAVAINRILVEGGVEECG